MKKYALIVGLLALGACRGTNTSEINGDMVFFAFDSAVVSDEAKKELLDQSLFMKQNRDINVVMEGHCDERGSTEYNLALGALRAGNAAHVLIKDGIEPDRIKTISYGKERPQFTGTGERVWALNRNATTVVAE
ncbi:MAG: OmpA family protein [Alphaproteobacteria bacterium]|nr:OmpA family protein [Alphaproteobacteria bacterium]